MATCSCCGMTFLRRFVSSPVISRISLGLQFSNPMHRGTRTRPSTCINVSQKADNFSPNRSEIAFARQLSFGCGPALPPEWQIFTPTLAQISVVEDYTHGGRGVDSFCASSRVPILWSMTNSFIKSVFQLIRLCFLTQPELAQFVFPRVTSDIQFNTEVPLFLGIVARILGFVRFFQVTLDANEGLRAKPDFPK